MKKIFAVALLVAVCFSCNVAQAMRPETVDIVKRYLDATEGFDKPICGGDVDSAVTFLASCATAYNALYEFLNAHPQEKNDKGYIIEFIESDDREVIHYAATVIIMRINTLNDYIIAMKAHEEKRYEYHKKMIELCSADWGQAVQMRQVFRDRYGF